MIASATSRKTPFVALSAFICVDPQFSAFGVVNRYESNEASPPALFVSGDLAGEPASAIQYALSNWRRQAV